MYCFRLIYLYIYIYRVFTCIYHIHIFNNHVRSHSPRAERGSQMCFYHMHLLSVQYSVSIWTRTRVIVWCVPLTSGVHMPSRALTALQWRIFPTWLVPWVSLISRSFSRDTSRFQHCCDIHLFVLTFGGILRALPCTEITLLVTGHLHDNLSKMIFTRPFFSYVWSEPSLSRPVPQKSS